MFPVSITYAIILNREIIELNAAPAINAFFKFCGFLIIVSRTIKRIVCPIFLNSAKSLIIPFTNSDCMTMIVKNAKNTNTDLVSTISFKVNGTVDNPELDRLN